MKARFDDLLYFPFWFAIDNVWWWSFVIWTVGLGFPITGQEVDMKDGVDFHRWGKGQAVGHRGQLPINKEWSVSMGC